MLLRMAMAAIVVAAAASPAVAQTFGAGGVGNWSGPYATVFGGSLRSDGRTRLDAYEGDIIVKDVEVFGLFPLEQRRSEIGTFGGIGFGYGVQRDAIVLGVEADIGIANTRVEHFFSRIDPNPNPMFNGVETNTTYVTDFGGLATLRVRTGYAMGPTLLFATGGLAVGRVTNRFRLEMPNLVIPGLAEDGYRSEDFTIRATRTGFIVGGGIERRLGDSVGLRAEVMHFDLGDVTIRARDERVFPDNGLDYRFRNSGQIGRIGLTFRF